jgi:hypothetical protein
LPGNGTADEKQRHDLRRLLHARPLLIRQISKTFRAFPDAESTAACPACTVENYKLLIFHNNFLDSEKFFPITGQYISN